MHSSYVPHNPQEPASHLLLNAEDCASAPNWIMRTAPMAVAHMPVEGPGVCQNVLPQQQVLVGCVPHLRPGKGCAAWQRLLSPGDKQKHPTPNPL